uniref:Matrin-type domain-containing protein n=1 Tax=Oryzias latipes TaxID=8090 RepID=A0A3P9IAI1_ORYLA
MVTLFLMLDFLQPPCATVGGGREEGPPAGRLPGGPSAGGPSAAEPLQAQLTLQRLKLAHGGSAAAASSVLNQLLSNANMFNQLQTPSIVGNPPGAFPTAVMGFPSSNAAVRPSVSVGLNQSSANVRLNPISGEYGKPSGSVFSCDSDRRFQFGSAGASSAASVSAGDQQYSGITTQAQNTGIHRDFFGQDVPAGFPAKEQNSAARKEQWKGPNNTLDGKVDMVSNPPAMWMPPGQPIQSRTELYDPEEPTAEPKLNCRAGISAFGSSCTAGFGGFPPLHGSEETLSSGVRTLQPYQVNDYYDVTPTQLPHQCSICDKKVYNLKVSGSLTVSSCSSMFKMSLIGSKMGLELKSVHGVPYAPSSSVPYAPSSSVPYLFAPSQASAGRVVHICNLPEGSCTENDVINLGLPFGKVTNYILMRSTHQVLLSKQAKVAVVGGSQMLRMRRFRCHITCWPFLHSFMLERPRSRSPINHSPPSHSPSFASCGSAHSPPAALCRGPQRNGLGPHRSSWVWPSHVRRSEEERDREDPWRNEGSLDDDLPNGRAAARRNTYQKHSDFGEGMRDNRERPPRGSPQGFSSYRSLEDHFYSEQMYKSEKCLRPSYPRHDMKTKRRDGGDYHVRYRHPDFNLAEEPPCRPESGSKEKSISPQENTKTKDEDGDESGEDTDEECWFPTNMEELVTVDEVGGEDDSIIEPDLPEVEGFTSCPKETGVEASVEKPPAPPSLEPQEILTQKPEKENSGEETGVQTECRILFFIVPSSGFYCKLCELFYTSESAAKTTHCRSTVHYKNLQKYLSQLAEDSLSSVLN